MPYVYGHFEWPHCAELGYDFNHLHRAVDGGAAGELANLAGTGNSTWTVADDVTDDATDDATSVSSSSSSSSSANETRHETRQAAREGEDDDHFAQ